MQTNLSEWQTVDPQELMGQSDHQQFVSVLVVHLTGILQRLSSVVS